MSILPVHHVDGRIQLLEACVVIDGFSNRWLLSIKNLLFFYDLCLPLILWLGMNYFRPLKCFIAHNLGLFDLADLINPRYMLSNKEILN